MSNIKINPDIAGGVARNFAMKASDLNQIIYALSSEVSANVGHGKPGWEGTQAAKFEAEWETQFRPALDKLVAALNGANELLTKTISAYQTLDS